eukprot:276936-Pleurochrysis_carterae.AAC.6
MFIYGPPTKLAYLRLVCMLLTQLTKDSFNRDGFRPTHREDGGRVGNKHPVGRAMSVSDIARSQRHVAVCRCAPTDSRRWLPSPQSSIARGRAHARCMCDRCERACLSDPGAARCSPT